MKNISSGANIPQLAHKVYITDQEGIFDAFSEIRADLSAQVAIHLTVLYSVPEQEDKVLYEKELAVLQSRFPTSLILHIIAADNETNSIQEHIEVAVNSDVTDNITFFVFGEMYFVHSVTDIIDYLPIKSTVLTTIK